MRTKSFRNPSDKRTLTPCVLSCSLRYRVPAVSFETLEPLGTCNSVTTRFPGDYRRNPYIVVTLPPGTSSQFRDNNDLGRSSLNIRAREHALVRLSRCRFVLRLLTRAVSEHRRRCKENTSSSPLSVHTLEAERPYMSKSTWKAVSYRVTPQRRNPEAPRRAQVEGNAQRLSSVANIQGRRSMRSADPVCSSKAVEILKSVTDVTGFREVLPPQSVCRSAHAFFIEVSCQRRT